MSSLIFWNALGFRNSLTPFPLDNKNVKFNLGFAWSQDLKSLPLFIKQVACT